MSSTHTLDRSRPPQPRSGGRTLFPTFARYALSNGVPVFVVENHVQPYLSVQLVLRSGASSDGDIPGLADFTGSLLLSGAGERDAQTLAEEIDYLGAILDAGAGRDEMTVGLGVLSQFLPTALDLMADVSLRPRFEAEEVDRERKQAIASILQSEADPSYMAAIRFRREVFGTGPFGTPLDGTRESLGRITRQACVAFHETMFTSGNAFIVAAGDIHPDRFVPMLEERFGSWNGERPPSPEYQIPKPAETLRIVIVDRPGSFQSAIRIGHVGIARRDPDYVPLVVANTLLGGYFNSRINNNLRERHGFTYGARSSVEVLKNPSLFSIVGSVGTAVTDRALEEMIHELRRMATEAVESDELEMTKNYLIGSQALQTETPGQIASFVRAIALYDLDDDYYRRFPEEIRAVTADDVLRVCQRCMDPSRMVAVIAGDRAGIESGLSRLGPVE